MCLTSPLQRFLSLISPRIVTLNAAHAKVNCNGQRCKASECNSPNDRIGHCLSALGARMTVCVNWIRRILGLHTVAGGGSEGENAIFGGYLVQEIRKRAALHTLRQLRGHLVVCHAATGRHRYRVLQGHSAHCAQPVACSQVSRYTDRFLVEQQPCTTAASRR